jgi:hypothetical protein
MNEYLWNTDGRISPRGNPKHSCPSAAFSTINPTRNGVGLKRGPFDEKPRTTGLNNNTGLRRNIASDLIIWVVRTNILYEVTKPINVSRLPCFGCLLNQVKEFYFDSKIIFI